MDKNTFKVILIANTAEAFKKILLEASGNDVGKRRIRHELALSQRAFFWEGDNKVVITPHLIPMELIEHNKEALGFSMILNLAPKEDRVDLCRAILDDHSLWGDIIRIIKENPGIIISPYAVTADFLFLIQALRRESLDFSAPEIPEKKSIWTVEYLDSKSGFRNQLLPLIKKPLSALNIPEGFICNNVAQTIEVGQQFIGQGRSCVIKSNLGESGWGVLICKKEQFKTSGDFENYITTTLEHDTIWKQLPLIVEEFIDPLFSVGGGMPSGEAFISPTGAEFKYACGQEINKKGEFLGITIGDGVLPVKLEKKIRLATEEIGRIFLQLGYRGFFDVDFVLAKNNNIYAIESNMRRTGGTHVYDLKQWIMKNNIHDKDLYILSHDSLVYSAEIALSSAKILDKAKDLLYPMNGSSSGIVISLINAVESVIGYMVVGQNKEQVDVIRSAFINTLSRKI